MNRLCSGGRLSDCDLKSSLTQRSVQVKGTLTVDRILTPYSSTDLQTQIAAQAGAIVANTAKVGITTAQTDKLNIQPTFALTDLNGNVAGYAASLPKDTTIASAAGNGALTFSSASAGNGSITMKYDRGGDIGGEIRFEDGLYLKTTYANPWQLWIRSNGVSLASNFYGQALVTTSAGNVSDDRIKFGESLLTDALAVVAQLRPMQYNRIPDSDVSDVDESTEAMATKRECGFIAQDIEAIPELSHCVTDYGPWPKRVQYNDILAYTATAVQELHRLVEAQANRISSLEARLTALE